LKKLALAILTMAALAMIYATVDFPGWGDPQSPASRHVSTRYIERSMEETAVPNVVTAVLADYRGYDTMFETVVVFAAGMICFFILSVSRRECGFNESHYRHIPTGVVLHMNKCDAISPASKDFEEIDSEWMPQDVVVKTVSRILIPYIQLYALYVLAHGHYSPGGGFQAGVIFASSFLLLALSHDLRTLVSRFDEKTVGLIAACGVIIYGGVGLIGMAEGVNFLDYGALAGLLGMQVAEGHSLGILLVEIGVAMTVMASLVMIFKVLSSRGLFREGL
jgi:multicomponent Na+:H+ antiporter subunit B